MNRKRRTKQLRKFINQYGTILCEYKRPPNKTCSYYRKGSYFACFESDELGFYCSIGDINKYLVYKNIVKGIKKAETLKRLTSK